MLLTKALVILLACHFIGDYCLTSKAMLEAKESGKNLGQLALHACINGLMIAVGSYFIGIDHFLLFSVIYWVVEFVTHFVIDYVKGLVGRIFPVFRDIHKKPYWILHGVDQMLHCCVIIWILKDIINLYPVYFKLGC